MHMHVVDLIAAKRDGGELSAADITALIDAYTRGDVPDYQMSAFLMAAFLKGMNRDEMVALTRSMLHSGTVLDLSDVPGRKVDKHSTGGVGDKISIPLAAMVAACGVPIPMISGRGLGHTGGTLDKLESIPGFSTSLDIPAYRSQLADLGVVMIGQTAEIAPADRKLYALRDVTATVEFIPFIAASILSKKLAEGIDALVLDVKYGSGAFMQDEAQARRLAETMVMLGEEFGKTTVALLTPMDVPLGRAVGNWVEVHESIDIMRGRGPADVAELTMALAAEMVVLGGRAASLTDARAQLADVVSSGRAFDLFCQLVAAQGGDVTVMHDPGSRPGAAPVDTLEAPAGCGPFVTVLDARTVGRAAVRIGAGRATKEDDVDPVAGFMLLKKPGDPVRPGEPLATLHASDPGRIAEAKQMLESAYGFGNTSPEASSAVSDRLTKEGWDGLA